MFRLLATPSDRSRIRIEKRMSAIFDSPYDRFLEMGYGMFYSVNASASVRYNTPGHDQTWGNHNKSNTTKIIGANPLHDSFR